MRILYFDIDSLRPDHLGAYGYNRPTSPTIDQLAREGVRFNHYYCASSPCLPSRTALVSGRFGIRNGVVSNHGAGAKFQIEAKAYGGPQEASEMFPRQLKRHGFDPICFSNFADRHFALWFMCGWSEFHTPSLNGGSELADAVNAPVLRWLQQHATRDNYYLHINYWDVHRPYRVPAHWATRVHGRPVTQAWPDAAAIAAHQSLTGPFTAHGQFPNDQSPHPLMPGAVTNRADFEKMITGYDASIAHVDHQIQLVLDELDRQGVLDETAVIISADHGDAFGEHGIYSDHVNVDECVHRVPLIIRWPGVTPPNTQCDAFMSNVDFAPTICDLLGLPIPRDWDGQSYKANVQGKPGADRNYLVWDSGLYTVQRAVRTKTRLYIRTYDADRYSNWAEEELYDMVQDPYETSNLAAAAPEQLQECRRLLSDWVAAQQRKDNWHGDPLQTVLRERREQAARREQLPRLVEPPPRTTDTAAIEPLLQAAIAEYTAYVSPVHRLDDLPDARLLEILVLIAGYNLEERHHAAGHAFHLRQEYASRLRRRGLNPDLELAGRMRATHAALLASLARRPGNGQP